MNSSDFLDTQRFEFVKDLVNQADSAEAGLRRVNAKRYCEKKTGHIFDVDVQQARFRQAKGDLSFFGEWQPLTVVA
jgi:hypothetical protein